jgi:hypothetical protein
MIHHFCYLTNPNSTFDDKAAISEKACQNWFHFCFCKTAVHYKGRPKWHQNFVIVTRDIILPTLVPGTMSVPVARCSFLSRLSYHSVDDDEILMPSNRIPLHRHPNTTIGSGIRLVGWRGGGSKLIQLLNFYQGGVSPRCLHGSIGGPKHCIWYCTTQWKMQLKFWGPRIFHWYHSPLIADTTCKHCEKGVCKIVIRICMVSGKWIWHKLTFPTSCKEWFWSIPMMRSW